MRTFVQIGLMAARRGLHYLRLPAFSVDANHGRLVAENGPVVLLLLVALAFNLKCIGHCWFVTALSEVFLILFSADR